jgi:N-acetylneuraminic acid mutarotase
MPTALANFGFGTLKGNDLIVAGGFDDRSGGDAYETFSASTRTWTQDGSIPHSELYVSSATGTNGDLYVIGGDLLQIYSAKTSTWTVGPKLPTDIWTGMSVVALPDGRILMIGGSRPTTGVTPYEVDAFTPATGKWAKLASVPIKSGRCGTMAAAASAAGTVYLEGGACTGGFSNQFYIFDTAKNRWSVGPVMPGTKVAEASGVCGSNGYFYVIGGTSKTSYATAQVRAYDPSANKWASEPSLPTASRDGDSVRVQSGAIVYGGGVTATGGFSSVVWQLATK